MAKKSLAKWKEEIKNLLSTNDRALVIAIIRLYDRQTADEQQVAQTTEENGIGFNGIDAEIMTSFAVQIKRRREIFDRGLNPLTVTQTKLARKIMLKYSGQLARIARDKAETVVSAGEK